MKLSISLPDGDVEFLDAFAEAKGIGSRSAVLQRAVRMLRDAELAAAYEDAWAAWDDGDDGELWETAAADGLTG